jgi:RecB family exonuclease
LLTWADPALLAEQAENISTWEDVFEVNFETELDALRAVEPDQTRWRTGGRKTKDRPNGEDVEWWRQAGRDMIRTYVAWRLRTSDTLHIAAVKGAAGVEVEVTTSFGGVPVRGFVDRLFLDTQTGAYLVVDYKTGANPPKAQLQLGQYSVQLEAMIGAPVRWGAYYDARKGELSKPFDLSGYTPERLGYIYGGLDTSIRSNIFLPNMTQCFSCGMRDACVFQGGIEPTPEKK